MKKVSRGRPPTAKLDSESIQEKIEFELLKSDMNAANNLPKYFELIDQYALGKVGSDTNKISSAKFMIEKALAFLEQQEAEGVNSEEGETPAQEKEVVQESASLISFDVAKKG